MNKIKILVVEDEILIADNICNKLKDFGYNVFEPALDFEQAITSIKAEKPDIAILDIQLPGLKSGIDLARKIKKEYNFPFIFLTSNSDKHTVSKAKPVKPSAFLVKPFKEDELYASIEIAIHSFDKSNNDNNNEIAKHDSLFIKHNGLYSKLKLEDVLFIKSAHVYLDLILKDRTTHTIRGSVDGMEQKLSEKFIRVHRSYIINMDYVTSIDGSSLKINDTVIPIGEKYRTNFFDRINVL